jgi:hypothetical protein
MPRNAAGVYSLPNPPRVPSTTIDSPDENVTRDDIGAELTNSLDRNGRGGMLAPFRIADGTMAAPGLAFLNDPDNGFWRRGGDDWAATAAGSTVMIFTPNTVTLPVGVSMGISGSLTVGGLAVTANLTVGGNLTVTGGGITAPNVGQPLTLFSPGPGLRIANANIPVSVGNDGVSGYPAVGYNWNGAGIGLYSYAGPDVAHLLKFEGSVPQGFRFLYAGAGLAGQIIPFAEQFRILSRSDAVNFITANAGPDGNTIGFTTTGASANIILGLTAKGAAGFIALATGAPAIDQVRILSSAGPNVLTLAGGANPTIGVTGGKLVLPQTSLQVGAGVSALDIAGFTVLQFAGANELKYGGSVVGQWQALGFYANGVEQLRITPGNGVDHRSATSGSFAAIFTSFDAATTPLSLWRRVDNAVAAQMTMLASGAMQFGTTTAHPMTFISSAVERARITTTGFFKASDVGNYVNPVSNNHEFRQENAAGLIIALFDNSSTGAINQYGVRISNANDPNDSTRYFLNCQGAGATRFQANANGGLVNFQANNANLCDAVVKDNIQPLGAADASALWNAHRDVAWCSFKYIDQTHDDPNFGYLAQDIEKKFANVAPWLVDELEVGLPGESAKRKYVYNDDLHNIGQAVLSAAQKRIEALETALIKNGITLN